MGFGVGQPSPFYLQALASPLGGTGGQGGGMPSAGLTNSAYALLNSFFSPQRTTAPTSLSTVNESHEYDSEDKAGERSRKRSALAASASADYGNAGGAGHDEAGAAPAAKMARRNTQPKLELDAGAQTDGTRLLNRRFSSGTPLASPGRLSRSSSKDMLFSYDNKAQSASTAAAHLARSCSDAQREVARVTSSVESSDATPL
jgi:hypothetical protein